MRWGAKYVLRILGRLKGRPDGAAPDRLRHTVIKVDPDKDRLTDEQMAAFFGALGLPVPDEADETGRADSGGGRTGEDRSD